MRLEAMAIRIPVVAGHPNRTPFEGVLTLVDEPSDRAPSGARGHRVVLSRSAAMAALPSLLGMAVDYRPGWDGHDARRKCGIITEADVHDSRVCRRAAISSAATFPRSRSRCNARRRGTMGMSYELADAHVADMRAESGPLPGPPSPARRSCSRTRPPISKTTFRLVEEGVPRHQQPHVARQRPQASAALANARWSWSKHRSNERTEEGQRMEMEKHGEEDRSWQPERKRLAKASQHWQLATAPAGDRRGGRRRSITYRRVGAAGLGGDSQSRARPRDRRAARLARDRLERRLEDAENQIVELRAQASEPAACSAGRCPAIATSLLAKQGAERGSSPSKPGHSTRPSPGSASSSASRSSRSCCAPASWSSVRRAGSTAEHGCQPLLSSPIIHHSLNTASRGGKKL